MLNTIDGRRYSSDAGRLHESSTNLTNKEVKELTILVVSRKIKDVNRVLMGIPCCLVAN